MEAEAESATAEKIEDLKLQVEAKRKMLQSVREREQALTEKWRADKAQTRAEIHQLDAKLRKAWRSVEDEKSAAEAKVREAQDAHEKAMRLSRQRIEQQLKDEYEPQIAALQESLKAKREQEEKLRSLLSAQGETQDILHTAIASALSTIMDRIQSVFAAQSASTEEWTAHLRELVRNEVRSSFAVSLDNEAQTERDEYRRYFVDLMEFWSAAEDEVRERMVKMDDALLSDLQTVLRDDLARLQKEELAMEDVYVQSREAWAMQHQEMLRSALDATMKRREEELEDYRKARHQLHLDRLRDIEEHHKDVITMEEALHHKEMQLLRQHFSNEEQLHAHRHRVALAAQEDVSKSTDSLKAVVGCMDGVLATIKSYQAAVEEGRVALDAERQTNVSEQEKMLQSLQSIVASQCVSVEEETRSLADATSKLQIVHDQVAQQLENEATWLAQQEATYTKGKEAWEREYQRWKQLVQRERAAVQERFHTTLLTLQESASAMDAEERDLQVEADAMKRSFAEVSVMVDKELSSLKDRESYLDSRRQTLSNTLGTLERKGEEASAQWRAMQQERNNLAKEKDELRGKELELQHMSHSLSVLKSQMEGLRAQAQAAAERSRSISNQLHINRDAIQAQAAVADTFPAGVVYQDPANMRYATVDAAPRVSHRHPRDSHRKDRKRLPQKVLEELRQQLDGAVSMSMNGQTPPQQLIAAARHLGVRQARPAPASTPDVLAAAVVPEAQQRPSRFSPSLTGPSITQQQQQQQRYYAEFSDGLRAAHATVAEETSTYGGSHTGEATPGRTFTELVAITDGDRTSPSQAP